MYVIEALKYLAKITVNQANLKAVFIWVSNQKKICTSFGFD